MRRYAILALRALIGLVFVYAAWTKLRDPWTLFAMSVDSYHLLSENGVIFVARTLPWFELALGIAVLSGIALRYSSIAAAALLGGFFTVMAIEYAHGAQIDCGCFGPGEALGPVSLLRDGTLVALAIALAILAFARRPASSETGASSRDACGAEAAH